jgi:mannose-6-phosphate isomerase-like protein (cupin superfamily)
MIVMQQGSAPSLPAWVESPEAHQHLKWLGTTRLQVLADAARTGGQLTIIEERSNTGDATPLHVHHHEDEMFWLLEGAMTAWVGDERLDLAPGGFAFLPRGIPHAYRLMADNSRILIIATPAGIEDMFREAGWDLSTPPPPDWSVSIPLLTQICERRETPILGPPPEV